MEWNWWQIIVVVLLGGIFGALMDIRKTLFNVYGRMPRNEHAN